MESLITPFNLMLLGAVLMLIGLTVSRRTVWLTSFGVFLVGFHLFARYWLPNRTHYSSALLVDLIDTFYLIEIIDFAGMLGVLLATIGLGLGLFFPNNGSS